MRPNEMHKQAHAGTHLIAPKPWRAVPKVTGDYDMDASILHCNNKDMPLRLALYSKGSNGHSYGPVTNYNGYHNYHGDD